MRILIVDDSAFAQHFTRKMVAAALPEAELIFANDGEHGASRGDVRPADRLPANPVGRRSRPVTTGRVPSGCPARPAPTRSSLRPPGARCGH